MSEIRIRLLDLSDIAEISREYRFPWSTIAEVRERWRRYYKEQQENSRIVGVIDQKGMISGYGSLLFNSEYAGFSHTPEISDVWIDQDHRGKGYGRSLILWLEERARERGYKEIGIGVGLYADYGRAQRLYVNLGYVPDGNGLTYAYRPAMPGQSYRLDDELILWLKKSLKAGSEANEA